MVKDSDVLTTVHHVRCDAHRHNITTGMQRMIGEVSINDSQKYAVHLSGTDSIEIRSI